MTNLTKYEKALAQLVAENYGGLPVEQIIERLCLMGVVDHTQCKVLAVRTCVDTLVRGGQGKVDAMWQAAEHFCATYEYVRKCMYYYKDVNF